MSGATARVSPGSGRSPEGARRRAIFAAACGVLATVLASPGPAGALPPGVSEADADACRPDVFRLCFEAIPDEQAIVACLRRRLTALSPECRVVMDPPRQQRR